MRNAGLKFVCRTVHLRVESAQSIFTSGYASGQVIAVPVAHNDGNYFADDATLDRLADRDRIAFRYVDEDGREDDAANPHSPRRHHPGIFHSTNTLPGPSPPPHPPTHPPHRA